MKPNIVSVPALLAAALAWGCREPASFVPPPAIANEVVSREGAMVLPDIRWKDGGAGRWKFANRASLVCWIRAAGGEPLVIRLRTHGGTARHHFRYEWDGEQLPAERIERLGEGERQRGGVLRIELPGGELTPGGHELTLYRDYKRDARETRSELQNVFASVRYRFGDKAETLRPERLAHYQLLSHFLQFGVIGTTRELRGGLLFVGPARRRLEFAASPRRTLRLEPQNLSGQPAVFRAADKSLTLGPGERGSLAVGPGTELEVEGEAGGYFLWGMPWFDDPAAFKALPPIVLITLDTTRRDALSPYGGRADLTPELGRLARGATVFERAYSTAPWTLPSHASIFTGLYPSKHGAGVSRKHLAEMPTLARLLRRRGYFAAGFSSGDLSASRFGLAQGFHYYRDPDQFETPGANLAGYLDEFLDAHGDRPLFLFINYFDAHALYQAPQEWQEKTGVPALAAKLRGSPGWEELANGEMSGWRRLVEGETAATPDGLAYLRAAYHAEVAWVDHLLGRLFAKLRQLDLYDRALIVVTADHGELLGEGGYYSHGARLDPELVEVPLLVKWPGQTTGRRSGRLVSLIDLFPTILRAAGVAPPPSDGLLLERDAADGAPQRSYVLIEEHESIVHPLPASMKVARHLFAVQRPGFRQVVWDDDQRCARRNDDGWHDESCASEARSVLEAIRTQLAVVKLEDGDTTVLEEVRESLEALGYM